MSLHRFQKSVGWCKFFRICPWIPIFGEKMKNIKLMLRNIKLNLRSWFKNTKNCFRYSGTKTGNWVILRKNLKTTITLRYWRHPVRYRYYSLIKLEALLSTISRNSHETRRWLLQYRNITGYQVLHSQWGRRNKKEGNEKGAEEGVERRRNKKKLKPQSC